MKKLALIVGLFAIIGFTFTSSFSTSSFAHDYDDDTPTPTSIPKLTICHATSSTTNPYVSETIDKSSLGDGSGHGSSGINTGDIIPPMAGTNYPNGQNWNTTGKAIWNNGCGTVFPTPTHGVTPTPTYGVIPTPTQGVTLTPTQGVTPTPTSAVTLAPTVIIPTATPTTVITPTLTPSGNGGQGQQPNNPSDGRSSCPQCTQAPVQEVLGVSTMADTGTFDTTVMNFVLLGGMLSMGAAAYAKAKKA
ncbi:MAG: hypothetical protein KGJ07_05920 [Patescibacteria group bacterium]|nr:hypothetical protein [Patescibacteria group bacterium]